MKRRPFLCHLAASAMLAAVPSWRRAGPASGTVVRLQFVSAFDAPYVADRLHVGLPLDVRVRSGRACVFLTDKLLGWLPPGRQWDAGSCRLAAIGRDHNGRLLLYTEA